MDGMAFDQKGCGMEWKAPIKENGKFFVRRSLSDTVLALSDEDRERLGISTDDECYVAHAHALPAGDGLIRVRASKPGESAVTMTLLEVGENIFQRIYRPSTTER